MRLVRRSYETFIIIFFLIVSFIQASLSIDANNFLSEKKEVRILAIDGGGIRSIIPATILEMMEENLQLRGKHDCLAKHFDIIAGTSTGGAIALSLGNGQSAAEIAKFYYENGEKIFHPDIKNNTLEEVLLNHFDDKWLKDFSYPRILIPSYNIGQNSAYLFDTHEARQPSHNFKIRDIARVSFSKLLDLKTIQIKDEKEYSHNFCSGTEYALDPTFEALKIAQKTFQNCNSFSIVSLGTGEPPRKFGSTSLDKKEIPNYLINNSQDRHLNYLGYIQESKNKDGKEIKYYRIQLTLDSSLNSSHGLRQAGMYTCNPQSTNLYNIFIKIMDELCSPTISSALNYLEISQDAYSLGLKYRDGSPNTLPNFNRALKYFTIAAQKDAKHGIHVAHMYLGGYKGIPVDYNKARRFYEEALKSGEKTGTLTGLAWMQDKGVGGYEEDGKKALDLYQQAVDAGDTCGWHGMGMIFETGRNNVPMNKEVAFECYQRAYNLKDLCGAYFLGRAYEEGWAYENGHKVKNLVKAVELYKEAATEDVDAKKALARMYEKGEGVQRDIAQAKILHAMASNQTYTPTD